VRQSSNRWEGNAEYTGPTKSAGSERGPNKAEALVQKKINPNSPTGLVPQKVDQEHDGVQQLKKPLNFENATDKNDFKDVYNPDKKPNPGAYNQKKAVEKPVVPATPVVATAPKADAPKKAPVAAVAAPVTPVSAPVVAA
tara:strand:+ start:636 stop:1055 length:420 start_codon:yes stop_codon:yes gene_type:complete